MSFLPQNKFVDSVFAYATGVALMIAGLLIVFGAVILALSGGYLIIAYFQKLLGVTGLTINALDVINRAEQLMFFGFFGPIEIIVGLLAIIWNALGQIVYDIINFGINLWNTIVVGLIKNIITIPNIGSVTWITQDTSNWITIITQIQTNLQAILFPPL